MRTLAAALSIIIGLISTPAIYGQYVAPTAPQPFAGFLNEALREHYPAATNWDIAGNLRLRYEIKEGSAIPGSAGSMDFRDHGADVSNDYFLSRLRLHAGFSQPWWSFYVEGRSSMAASDERFAYANNPPVPGTTVRRGSGPEADAIDLNQAYITLGNLNEFPLSLKVGRQELIYGEERLIGASAWNNIGRVFDAAKLRWQTAWFGADFFASRAVIPEDGRFNVDNDYEWFSGVYATINQVPKNLLEVYFLSRNASSKAIAAEPSPQGPQPSARDIYTVGGRVKSRPGEFGNWDYTVEGAYQFGSYKDLRKGVNSPRLDQDAFMFVAQGGYTFNDAWATPRLGAEYAFGSGDNDPNDNKHRTFDNLFPTNHKFYGYMDFFSLQNVHDLRGIFQLKPHPQVSVSLEGHGFWLADTHDNFYTSTGTPRGGLSSTGGAGYGINPSYSSFVGTEIDLVAGWALVRFAQLEAGYGHFFTGKYVDQSLSSAAFGSRDADWFYVQLSVTF